MNATSVVQGVSSLWANHLRWIVMAGIALLGAGAALAVGGEEGRLIALVVFGVLAAWIVYAASEVAVGLLPAVQAADWLRADTAIASLSPRTILIGLLAASRVRAYGGCFRSAPTSCS